MHSPEPWTVEEEHATCASADYMIRDAQGHEVFFPCCDECRIDDPSMSNEDIRRTVACVNAMQGIDNPEEFMQHIRTGMQWLGRAESGTLTNPQSMLKWFRKASDAAGGFEEYT